MRAEKRACDAEDSTKGAMLGRELGEFRGGHVAWAPWGYQVRREGFGDSPEDGVRGVEMLIDSLSIALDK